ncbi:hypothetical protein [Porphyrobacter sp. AAP60]|uniref:hypothetical protein n=1 Tax=Porphyrobacter sp. AAP60 TaxID=1523423 RepID=UPI000ADBACC4|nr:hypothetical protein [Porphyrobacter sp. AAP60]
MIFVRGIKGNTKLNPAIKVWGGLCLLVLIAAAGALWRFDAFRDRVEACEAKGGDWIGGALISAFCEPAPKREREFD